MSTELSISNESQAFELVQRQAKLLSSSTLVPKEFQGNMANCAIGLNIAKRLGADSFMVLQNIDVIHGRPSFRATFLIAMVNASGRFALLQFRMTGEGQTRACVAHTTVLSSGQKVEGPEITMAMAKAEGWSTKNGSKWLTMPELMLRYRAAAFFARIYAPDITLGMQTSEELLDAPPMRDVTPPKATQPVVDENPYVEPFSDITAAAPAKGKAKTKATPAPAAETEPEQEAPADTEDAVVMPPRIEMVNGFKADWKRAEVTQAFAEAKYIEAGVMEKGLTLSKLTDEQLFAIYEKSQEILGLKPEEEGDQA